MLLLILIFNFICHLVSFYCIWDLKSFISIGIHLIFLSVRFYWDLITHI